MVHFKVLSWCFLPGGIEENHESLQAEIQIWDVLDTMHYPVTLHLHTV
jgi:hypothetical protein